MSMVPFLFPEAWDDLPLLDGEDYRPPGPVDHLMNASHGHITALVLVPIVESGQDATGDGMTVGERTGPLLLILDDGLYFGKPFEANYSGHPTAWFAPWEDIVDFHFDPTIRVAVPWPGHPQG